MFRRVKRSAFSALAILLLGALVLVSLPDAAAMAPGEIQSCGAPQNISASPGFTSADPFLIADRTGKVHLFWGERIFGEPDAPPNIPDALVYSLWDGTRWSVPIDLFLSPPERANKRVSGIRGVITDDGYIHIIWIGPDELLFYSAAHASQASDASKWRAESALAVDQSGSQYSAAIAYTAPNTLHILYGRGASDNDNRSLVYIRSEDNGVTWSTPHEVFVFPQLGHGASNVRLLTEGTENVYATWTEWDNTGNGQAIYFARSQDNGLTWETPIVLDERLGNEYERDWATLAVLGPDQIVAFWEGGWRAYRQAQYSDDGGRTWSEPIDTLDWLISDNGFAEFVRDSAGRLHLFVFQRVREGNEDKGNREGLWHTMWEGGRNWREPEMVGAQNPSNFVTVDINNGNELFAAWFDYTYFEIHTMRCLVEGADPVAPQPWPIIPQANSPAEPIEEEISSDAPDGTTTQSEIDTTNEPQTQSSARQSQPIVRPFQNPYLLPIIAFIPTLAVLIVMLAFRWYRRQSGR